MNTVARGHIDTPGTVNTLILINFKGVVAEITAGGMHLRLLIVEAEGNLRICWNPLRKFQTAHGQGILEVMLPVPPRFPIIMARLNKELFLQPVVTHEKGINDVCHPLAVGNGVNNIQTAAPEVTGSKDSGIRRAEPLCCSNPFREDGQLLLLTNGENKMVATQIEVAPFHRDDLRLSFAASCTEIIFPETDALQLSP